MNLVEHINSKLTSKLLRRYLISLFIDTRLASPVLSEQIYVEPEGFMEALNEIKKYHLEFPKEIRKSYPNLYSLSVKIEKTNDDIERLAIWALYLDQQAV